MPGERSAPRLCPCPRAERSAPPACRGASATRSAANWSTPQSRSSKSPAPAATAVTPSSTVSTKTETVAARPGSPAKSVASATRLLPVLRNAARDRARASSTTSRGPSSATVSRNPAIPRVGELERRRREPPPKPPGPHPPQRVTGLHRKNAARYCGSNIGVAQSGHLERGGPFPPPGGGRQLDDPLGGSDTQIADDAAHQAAPSSCGARAYPSASIATRTFSEQRPIDPRRVDVLRIDGQTRHQSESGCLGALPQLLEVWPGGFGVHPVDGERRDTTPVVYPGIEVLLEALGEVGGHLEVHLGPE